MGDPTRKELIEVSLNKLRRAVEKANHDRPLTPSELVMVRAIAECQTDIQALRRR